jgi:hypothetical protein
MLKKIIAILLIISAFLALGACSRPAEDTTVSTESEVVTTIDTTEEDTTEAETEAAETKSIDLTGTFIPTNYADKEYTSIPHITFFGDENCIMYFPLKEGACQFNGKYSVVDNTWIKIKLDLSESEFKGYVPEEFEFAGGTNNHFMLTSTGFSGIALGDKFKRVTQEELSELGITIEDTEEVNVNASPFIDGVEPLLTEIVLSKSVPDFLDEEQQILYRKAFSLIYYRSVPTYRSMEFADSLNYYIGKYNIIKPYGDNSGNYRISQGRYQNWEDFIALLYSVFTEEFAVEAFSLNKALSGYYNHYGKLAEIDASGIWSNYFSEYNKETFELISKTDSEVVFNIYTYQNRFYPYPNETIEERDARMSAGWEWVKISPVRMINTEYGWRVDHFYDCTREEDKFGPPLSKEDFDLPVPDFLDFEQQLLYRRAHNAYLHLWGGSAELIEYPEFLREPIDKSKYQTIEDENGRIYTISQGYFKDWSDFKRKLIGSIFTENLFNEKNSDLIYINHNGMLAFDNSVTRETPKYKICSEDEFEIVSKNDHEIVFKVISHYEDNNENKENLTEEFTIRMVMTKSGWRFDEFHVAPLESSSTDNYTAAQNKEVDTSELETEAETQESGKPELISDEEAIELFEIAEYTSMQWLSFNFDPKNSTDADPVYREYTDSKLIAYYPLTKESHAYMDTPDIRGNTKIYYGDHEWMEENLRKIFTEKYIKKYFSYGYPSPLIYENGIVYSMPASSQSVSTARTKTYENPTVIHKTEDELAIICEVYSSDPVTHKLDYSKIDGLAYMKLVKSNGVWLIDEHYSAKTGSVKTGIIMPKDLIPSEYLDNIPEKYRNMTSYFEGYEEDKENRVHEVDITGFDELNFRIDGGDGKPYVTKDEILEFDKNAVFIGPDRSFTQYRDKYSSFEIMSTNCTLWGKDCFVKYSGRIRGDSEYITEEENALYGIAYMYNGDGSDILFDPKMVITIPNITYNDFVYVLENVSELMDVDFESFFDTNLNRKMQRIRDAYTDNTIFIDTGEPIWFTIGGGKISIEIFGAQELKGAQSDALNDNPLTMRAYNMMKIHVN